MPPAKAASSPQCVGAVQLDWPEQHARCAGNTTVRIPGVPVPVLTYSCGCDCHTPAVAPATAGGGECDVVPD